jgi:hypothetical protein
LARVCKKCYSLFELCNYAGNEENVLKTPQKRTRNFWKLVYRQADDTIVRKIAGETLLIPIRGQLADMQHIYTLNPVAEFIWRQIDGTRSCADIRARVLEKYDADLPRIEADLKGYLAQLAARGLVLTQKVARRG